MQDILYGYILNLNENEHFVVGLRSVIILYIYHGYDRYLSQQQRGYNREIGRVSIAPLHL